MSREPRRAARRIQLRGQLALSRPMLGAVVGTMRPTVIVRDDDTGQILFIGAPATDQDDVLIIAATVEQPARLVANVPDLLAGLDVHRHPDSYQEWGVINGQRVPIIDLDNWISPELLIDQAQPPKATHDG